MISKKNFFLDEEGFYTRMLRKEFDCIQQQKTSEQSKSDSISKDETPILFLDINFGNGKSEKISVFANSDPITLAQDFAKQFSTFVNCN